MSVARNPGERLRREVEVLRSVPQRLHGATPVLLRVGAGPEAAALEGGLPLAPLMIDDISITIIIISSITSSSSSSSSSR